MITEEDRQLAKKLRAMARELVQRKHETGAEDMPALKRKIDSLFKAANALEEIPEE